MYQLFVYIWLLRVCLHRRANKRWVFNNKKISKMFPFLKEKCCSTPSALLLHSFCTPSALLLHSSSIFHLVHSSSLTLFSLHLTLARSFFCSLFPITWVLLHLLSQSHPLLTWFPPLFPLSIPCFHLSHHLLPALVSYLLCNVFLLALLFISLSAKCFIPLSLNCSYLCLLNISYLCL